MYYGFAFDKAEEKYVVGKFIGAGSYGAVVRAFDRSYNRFLAVKKVANVYDDFKTNRQRITYSTFCEE